MNNNILNWFRATFHDDYDEDGAHRVMSNDCCFVKDLTEELIEVRKNDIKNILRILNDNFPISDGCPSWLETEEDFERTANEILNWEKHYARENE
jgi:hypothetical protein